MQSEPSQGIGFHIDDDETTTGATHQIDAGFLAKDWHPVDAAVTQSGAERGLRPGRTLDVAVTDDPNPLHGWRLPRCCDPSYLFPVGCDEVLE
jgi:hypothetical protein